MRILVTGREGQVARSLAERAAAYPGTTILLVGRPDLDLLQPESVRSAVAKARPDVVVSAAAYTAVDRAEDEAELAFAVNAVGAGAVAAAAAEAGAPVIHLSTDYVFPGDGEGEHAEIDPTGPTSVYGRSKLAGEMAVAGATPRHVILRTAWVYSPYGRNFVKAMLGLARERDSVRVVADQWGNPTAAADIADGILRVAAAILSDERPDHFGVFHLAGGGSTSWAGFARALFAESARRGGPHAAVEDIGTAEYPTRARRPRNSRLSSLKFAETFGWRPPAWQDSCRRVVVRLVEPA